MPNFEIHTLEEVHGVYVVQAADENEAREMFYQGDVPNPSLYECNGNSTIDQVREL